MATEYIREILTELEVVGLIERQGFRRSPKTGELTPVYVLAPGISEAEAQRWLQLLAENDRRPPQ
jgi:hypothetical protein